jgi:hypothetical protein
MRLTPVAAMRLSMVAGLRTVEDWVRSLDCSICLLQSSRLRCKPAVSNVAMKSMDCAPPRSHQESLATGSFAGHFS